MNFDYSLVFGDKSKMVESIQQSMIGIGCFTKEEAIEVMNEKGMGITCDVTINDENGIKETVKGFYSFGCLTEINDNGKITKSVKSWYQLPEHSLDDVNIICNVIEKEKGLYDTITALVDEKIIVAKCNGVITIRINEKMRMLIAEDAWAFEVFELPLMSGAEFTGDIFRMKELAENVLVKVEDALSIKEKLFNYLNNFILENRNSLFFYVFLDDYSSYFKGLPEEGHGFLVANDISEAIKINLLSISQYAGVFNESKLSYSLVPVSIVE